MALTSDNLKDLMAYGSCVIDEAGYDPYNHVGVQIRRHQHWQDMRDEHLAANQLLRGDNERLQAVVEAAHHVVSAWLDEDFGAGDIDGCVYRLNKELAAVEGDDGR